MKRRRVKITGIGPVTPAGIGKEEFWHGILEPVSRVRMFTKLGEELGPFVATFIDDFEVGKYMENVRLPKGTARHTLFAVGATALAMRDAGVSAAELDESNCVIVTGSAIMDFGGILSSMDGISARGVRGARPALVNNAGHGCVANSIRHVLGISSRTLAVSNQCCSGMDAIGYAASLISTGEAEIAICGGTESPLHRTPLVEFRSAGLTPATSEMAGRLARPFDLWRTTGVVGEGACMFILEPESSPRPGYSYVAGYGSSHDDADDLCSGLAIAGKLAAAEAGVRLSEIEVINAWGPGHRQIDKGEAKAIHTLFGADTESIPTTSIKAAIGMPLGAAPAIQIAAAALSQRFGIVPPTTNWKYRDPDCLLRLSDRPMGLAHENTLVNAHGMGAVNSVMILQRC